VLGLHSLPSVHLDQVLWACSEQ